MFKNLENLDEIHCKKKIMIIIIIQIIYQIHTHITIYKDVENVSEHYLCKLLSALSHCLFVEFIFTDVAKLNTKEKLTKKTLKFYNRNV